MTDPRPSNNAGDTWDITTSLGATALGVAAYRAAESVQESPLVRDELATLLIDAVGLPGWQRLARADTSWLDDDDDHGRRALAAARDFVAVRTVYFDRFVETANTAGINQIVIMAAGLDARAYRMSCLRKAVVFELDQPAVLEFKRSSLAALEVNPIAMLEAVAVDLRGNWGAALVEHGFQPRVPTAWLVEGLLPYVPSDGQRRLVAELTALSARGSRLAAEAYPSAATHLGPARMAAWRANSAKVRERLGVGVDVTTLTQQADPIDVAILLADKGWNVSTVDSREEMDRLGRHVADDLLDHVPVASLITAEFSHQ